MHVLNDITNAIVWLSNALLLLAQTMIVSFGTPLALALFAVVEHRRVSAGIELFEVDVASANFAAAAVVIVNLAMEFQIHARYVSDARRKSEDIREALADYKPSLRLRVEGVLYWLGIGKGWKPKEMPQSWRYEKLARLVTTVIIVLAVAGSMKGALLKVSVDDAGKPVPWTIGVQNVIAQSTLIEMLTWAGGFALAVLLVSATRGMTRYIAERVAAIPASTSTSKPARRYKPTMNIRTANENSFGLVHNGDPYSLRMERMNERTVNSANAANGYSKNMNAANAVREYLEANSERGELWEMTADEFHAELIRAGINVGRTKAYEIRKEMQ